MVSVVIPVYNEEKILENNVKKLLNFFKNPPQSPFDKGGIKGEFQIIISDNASSDKTPEIAKKLAEKFPEIKYLRLEKKGKGLAIAEGWRKFPAEIYLFLDADLSCDLNDIPKFIGVINPSYKIPLNPPLLKGEYKIPLNPPLLKGEEEGNFDLACGSRHLKNSKNNRPLARKAISKIWNLLPKILLGTKLTDTACGIKAVNQRVIDEILPKVKNYGWFFDTELILRAENTPPPPTSPSQKEGEERWGRYKIIEIPITWTEQKERKSKVSFLKVGWEYIRNLMRLKSKIRNNPL